MDCLLAFFTVLALLVATIGAVLRRGSGKSRRRRSYQQLAQRFTGRYHAGGLFSGPALFVRHGETRAVLRETTGLGPYRGHCTQLQFDFPDSVQADLFPRGDAQEATPWRRVQPVSTGNATFDKAIIVRAHPTSKFASYLSDGVRWQLNRLLVLADDPGLYVRFHRGQVTIQKPLLLRDFEWLEELVAAGLDLCDQLLLTRAEGIEFVEGELLNTLEDVTCTICGEQVLADMVYCKRCKTPHHGECWEYAGGCSVFGCQETQSLRPQTGRSCSAHSPEQEPQQES